MERLWQEKQKQDRVVRSMNEQVLEHLHQLKSLASNPGVKEMDVERWCEAVLKTVLKNCLSYSATMTSTGLPSR